MSLAPNEWDLARRLTTLSLNIGRHPGGFLVVFLVTSYFSVSPSAPHSLHNSLYFNASFHILGSRLFIGMNTPQTRQHCNTARAFVSGCFAGRGTFPREGIARAAGGLCPEEAAALKGWQRIFKGANASALWVGALMDPNLCKIGVRPCVLLTHCAATRVGAHRPVHPPKFLCWGSGARCAGRLAGMGSVVLP